MNHRRPAGEGRCRRSPGRGAARDIRKNGPSCPPDAAQCRLLALDLDDTLLGPDRRVGSTARAAVRLAREAGIIPVVATGRPYASAALFARRLETGAPVIANTGAVIRDADGAPLRDLHLEAETCSTVVRAAEDEGWVVYLYTPRGVYCNRDHPDRTRYARLLEVPIEVSKNLAERVRAAGDPVTGAGLRVRAEEGEAIRHRCRRFWPKVQIMRSVPTLIEILPAGADKGRALQFLCHHLGISPAASAAVGDGPGDVDMLRAAGCGIFVSNADADLHPLADWVTDQPHTEGVMQVVRCLIRDGVG